MFCVIIPLNVLPFSCKISEMINVYAGLLIRFAAHLLDWSEQYCSLQTKGLFSLVHLYFINYLSSCSKDDNFFSGGDDTNPNPIFPIAPQWVDNLIYIGREIIGVEYLKEKDEDLTEVHKS